MPTPTSVAYYHNIDLVTNQLLNARLHPLTTAERTTLGGTLSMGQQGLVVYDTTLDKLYSWDGTQWVVTSGDNIYTVNGTLTGNRTVTMGGYWLDFAGGDVKVSTGSLTIGSIAAAVTDTDQFLVSDNGVIKYRTGSQVLADIGAAAAATGLPAGGAAGDILAKVSTTDYDVAWIPNYTSDVQHYVKLGATMTKGTPVYISGSTGNSGTNMIVSKASYSSEAASSKTLGLIASSGVTNDIVFVVTEGLLSGIDTSTATAGDPVWLGPNGTLLFGVANKPSAPNHMVYLGVVTRAHAINGEVFVHVVNGFEMDELHDVQITSVANKDILYRDSATNLWKNASIATILGYTPVTSSRTLTINGTAYDLSADRIWSIGTITGSGTANYVSKWTGSTALGNSLIYDNGTNVLIGTTNDNSYGKLQVDGGGYFTGNIYIETSANPTQFMLRGTNPEFWFDGAYGGGTSRIFINRATSGNQSTLVFSTGANVVKGSAWDSSGSPWTMGLSNNSGATSFKFGYGDIYGSGTWVWSASPSRVLTFTNTPYVNSYYMYHQGNLTLQTLGFPTLTGNSGKFLTTDGSTISWGTLSTTLASIAKSDYDADITGSRNSSNTVFTLSNNFVAGSTRVFVNGLRYSPGASADYVETGTNQITFTNPPDSGDLLVVDYIKS